MFESYDRGGEFTQPQSQTFGIPCTYLGLRSPLSPPPPELRGRRCGRRSGGLTLLLLLLISAAFRCPYGRCPAAGAAAAGLFSGDDSSGDSASGRGSYKNGVAACCIGGCGCGCGPLKMRLAATVVVVVISGDAAAALHFHRAGSCHVQGRHPGLFHYSPSFFIICITSFYNGVLFMYVQHTYIPEIILLFFLW